MNNIYSNTVLCPFIKLSRLTLKSITDVIVWQPANLSEISLSIINLACRVSVTATITSTGSRFIIVPTYYIGFVFNMP